MGFFEGLKKRKQEKQETRLIQIDFEIEHIDKLTTSRLRQLADDKDLSVEQKGLVGNELLKRKLDAQKRKAESMARAHFIETKQEQDVRRKEKNAETKNQIISFLDRVLLDEPKKKRKKKTRKKKKIYQKQLTKKKRSRS